MWPFKKKEIPLCKDCKHIGVDMSLEHSTCGANKKELNPITGELKIDYCCMARERYSSCGKYGKLFEKKEDTIGSK